MGQSEREEAASDKLCREAKKTNNFHVAIYISVIENREALSRPLAVNLMSFELTSPSPTRMSCIS